MKITIFTTAHPLDDVRVQSKFARSFKDRGNQVAWIGPDRTAFDKPNHRIPGTYYDLFPSGEGRKYRLLGMPRGLLKLSRHRGADWIYCPDPDAAVIAVLLRPLHGARIIFDVHEEYHGDLLSRWLGGRFERASSGALQSILRAVASRVAILTGVNEPVLAPYVDEAPKSVILRNSAPSWFSDIDVPHQKSESPIIFFHGKAAGTNGTTQILDAISDGETDSRFVMMPSPGTMNNPPYLEGFPGAVAARSAAKNLILVDSVPHELMPELMDTCHVGMIGYGRKLGKASLPNRLFEYMARGLAIMAPTYSPLIREIVERHNIGILRDFEDPHDIRDGIEWFNAHPEAAKEMGVRARKAFLAEYSWEADFEKLYNLMS